MTTFDLAAYLERGRKAVDAALDHALPPLTDDPARLREAMRYAVLQGGKRMRPMVILAACEAVGGVRDHALPACCALEMIHAYSLVHDDLPAMDNDVERRGQPTVHVKFGEGPGILVGDALLTDAFGIFAGSSSKLSGQAIARGVTILAKHAGLAGMVGGQALDITLGQAIPDLTVLERVHAMKTGGLYAAAGALGALAGGGNDSAVEKLERWGLCFGIAFQHADDILDDEQAVLRDAAVSRVKALVAECQEIANSFGDHGQALHAIATWVLDRTMRGLSGDRAD